MHNDVQHMSPVSVSKSAVKRTNDMQTIETIVKEQPNKQQTQPVANTSRFLTLCLYCKNEIHLVYHYHCQGKKKVNEGGHERILNTDAKRRNSGISAL